MTFLTQLEVYSNDMVQYMSRHFVHRLIVGCRSLDKKVIRGAKPSTHNFWYNKII